MQYKHLAALILAGTALAAPSPDATATAESGSIETDPGAEQSAAAAASSLVAKIPSAILKVMETAIPATWQDEILTNPAFLSSVASAAAAGTYPAWYSSLPNSVKAWATSNFDADILGVSATVSVTATQHGGTSETASAVQSASNSAQTTESGSSAATPSSGSASTSASVSSAKSTGGVAPAPTGGIAMGVAGAAGVAALYLAL